jgi:hypothetical protein
MQAAIKMHDMGQKEDDFVNFAREIWKSLEMNDRDELYGIIQSAMIKDLMGKL